MVKMFSAQLDNEIDYNHDLFITRDSDNMFHLTVENQFLDRVKTRQEAEAVASAWAIENDCLIDGVKAWFISKTGYSVRIPLSKKKVKAELLTNTCFSEYCDILSEGDVPLYLEKGLWRIVHSK